MISIFIFSSSFLLGLKEFLLISKFFFMDFFSIFMLMIFPLVSLIIFEVLFSYSMESDKWVYNNIFFFLFFFLFSCFSSSSSIIFFLFLELCSWVMIFFIFNYGKDFDKISSSIFMFLMNSIGSIPFMIFSSMYLFQSSYYFLGSSFDSFYIFIFYIMVLASKLPMFILHFWLTKAHVSASGSGSMILASLMLKISSIGLLKWGMIFSFFFLGKSNTILSFLVLTMIMILFLMSRFFDLKYLVACSSVSHMSLTLVFMLIYSWDMIYSSVLMMVGHGLVSCLVFFLVTLLYEFNQDRSICSSKSLESSSYFLFAMIIMWLILNLGFPPFVMFICEMMFFLCLKEFSSFLGALFLFPLIFSGMYFINLIINMSFFKKSIFSKDGLMIVPGIISIFGVVELSLLSFFF